MYRFLPVSHQALSARLPQPVSMRAPVVHLRSTLSDVQIDKQVRIIAENLDAAPLSATHVQNDSGIIVSGENSRTRNSLSPSTVLLTDEVKEACDYAAQLGKACYSFCSDELVGNQWQILAYREGGFFVPHYDDSYGHGGKLWRNRPDRALTVLLYLTDDYEGGELRFPRIVDEQGNPLTLKPRRGDFVAFPPHAQFEHEVLKVTSGLRINVSRWYDDPYWFKDFGALNDSFAKRLKTHFAQANWRFGHYTENAQTGFKYFDTVYVDTDVTNRNDLTVDLSLDRSPLMHELWTALKTDMCYGHSLQRCYANAQLYGTEGRVHTDSNDRAAITTMIYAVDDWIPQWAGETVFFDRALTKVVRAITPTPYKVVQFSSNTPHVARAVSRECRELRVTLMFKSRRMYELHPDTRPTSSPF